MAKSRKSKQQKELEKATMSLFRKIPLWLQIIIIAAIVIVIATKPNFITNITQPSNNTAQIQQGHSANYQQSYNTDAYEIYNGNAPNFSKDEISTEGYIELSELDSLGRCGPALACIGKETMPTEKRGDISSVKPSGWHTVKYPDIIKDKYLYNRCHLIGYQLSGLNAEKRNLITGTRYLNTEGMLPFENEIADYVKSTGNHVMYRVTPAFTGNELVARGVIMEAQSVEDNGKGVSFNVYCYNTQPRIMIDYETGDSMEEPK